MSKRAFDFIVSAVGIFVCSPLFLVVGALIKWDSKGPVFFKQERIGKNFHPFRIYKFRTMVDDASKKGGTITFGNDPRVTRVGRFLRRMKIDELPQLVNVLKGDMSLVGPRPEVREYVEMFSLDYQEILKVRPGITDLASLKYADEASILGESATPEHDYVNRVLPDKISLAKEYLRRSSFMFDLSIIFRSVPKLFGQKATA